jgi:hypothetical protein
VFRHSAITDWFAGRQPTAEQILTVQEFLEKQKEARKIGVMF